MTEASHPRWRPGREISTWPNLKFARAASHVRELQSRIETWSSIAVFRTEVALAEDHLSANVMLRLNTAPPLQEWALSVGDALSNMRSALDSLTWELAHLAGAPTKPKSIYFPICETEQAWQSALGTLKTIPAEALERMRLAQPFMYENGKSVLVLLNKLNNQDKHRSFIRSSVELSELHFLEGQIEFEEPDSVPDPPFLISVLDRLPLVDGQPLLRISSTTRMKTVTAPVMIKPTFLIHVDEDTLALDTALNMLLAQVRGTIDLICMGIPEQSPIENSQWTQFAPQIVDRETFDRDD